MNYYFTFYSCDGKILQYRIRPDDSGLLYIEVKYFESNGLSIVAHKVCFVTMSAML